MRAIVQHRYGPPEVLEGADVDLPMVGDDDVLVRVSAASVHPGDYFLMTGEPYVVRLAFGLRRPRHAIPSRDLAGVVAAVGKDVADVQRGDEVFGWSTTGTLAQYACVPAGQLVRTPANLSMAQAAAVPTSGLTALQANSIRHFVPLGDMLVLTSGSEWQLTTKNTDAMTQASIDYTPQGYVGASDVTPVVTSRAVLYAQDRGGHIREMQYKWESSGYDTVDVSIMAPHLFKNKTIKQMAFSRAPHNVCWAVRSDGVLLGMTYLPEHEVRAWHQHVTDGLVESICVVPEGSEDVLYMIVQRSLGSRTVRSSCPICASICAIRLCNRSMVAVSSVASRNCDKDDQS